MSNEPASKDKPPRTYPTLTKRGENDLDADVPKEWRAQDLMGMKTHDAAIGIYNSAITGLGTWAEKQANLASAMFAELEPRDAIEAMLIAQMTATHVAITAQSARFSTQASYQFRESSERSMTRLSRTYLAQMDALKKYRAKAQQTVRVERVNVESGGQAIVGNVNRTERAEHEQ